MSLSFDDRPAARPNILKEKCFLAGQAPALVVQALLPAVSTLVSRPAESPTHGRTSGKVNVNRYKLRSS